MGQRRGWLGGRTQRWMSGWIRPGSFAFLRALSPISRAYAPLVFPLIYASTSSSPCRSLLLPSCVFLCVGETKRSGRVRSWHVCMCAWTGFSMCETGNHDNSSLKCRRVLVVGTGPSALSLFSSSIVARTCFTRFALIPFVAIFLSDCVFFGTQTPNQVLRIKFNL